MKIMICGKGGSGKSTISVLLSRSMHNLGFNVILVDADESNIGISTLLGVRPPENLMDSFGGKAGFKEALNQGLSPDAAFGGKFGTDDIPENCRRDIDGIRLVSIGKIHSFGEGCACMMGVLSRRFLSGLTPRKKEIVIVDAEAGIEHLGRGVDEACDMLIGVIDPSAESFLLADRISEMGKAAGCSVFFILNKAEPEIEGAMRSKVDASALLGVVFRDNELFLASLEGRPLEFSNSKIGDIAERILEHMNHRGD